MAKLPIDALETYDTPPSDPKSQGQGLSEQEAFGTDLNPVRETPNAAKNLTPGGSAGGGGG